MPFGSNSRLLNLIAKGQNHEEVKSIIKSQGLFNAITSNGNTLLHHAVAFGNREILQYLIDSGSKLDAQNIQGQTPLIMALDIDQDSVEILIKAGADVYKRDINGISALQRVGSHDSWWGTHIQLSFFQRVQSDCMNNNEKIAEKLLEAKWILPKIVLTQDVDLTKIMLQRGCDIEAPANQGRTALHEAVKIVNPKIVKLLLDHNAHANAVDFFGQTPLSYVYCRDNNDRNDDRFEIFRLLLNRGADLFEVPVNRFGYQLCYGPAIYDVLWNGTKEVIQWLLRAYDDLSAFFIRDANRNTLAHFLVQNVNPGVLELLHDKNFDVNARSHIGETPLMLAATRGFAQAVQFLLDRGADIDARCEEDLTALSKAISNREEGRDMQYRECVQTLLEHGANTHINLDLTILDIVLITASFQLGELVLSHLAFQEALGTQLSKLIRNKINSNKRLKNNFQSSKRELLFTVYETVTVFELLIANERKLERYVRNQEFYSKLTEYCNEKCKFHYFNTILEKRKSKAIHTVEMRKKAALIICRIMEIDYEGFSVISDGIASYLEQEDMKNLLVAISQD